MMGSPCLVWMCDKVVITSNTTDESLWPDKTAPHFLCKGYIRCIYLWMIVILIEVLITLLKSM